MVLVFCDVERSGSVGWTLFSGTTTISGPSGSEARSIQHFPQNFPPGSFPLGLKAKLRVINSVE